MRGASLMRAGRKTLPSDGSRRALRRHCDGALARSGWRPLGGRRAGRGERQCGRRNGRGERQRGRRDGWRVEQHGRQQSPRDQGRLQWSISCGELKLFVG